MRAWVLPETGLVMVRITKPDASEKAWADMLAPAINAAIDRVLGVTAALSDDDKSEITAAAHRSFAYGWKMREAPFGQAHYLDDGGFPAKLADDYIAPVMPILRRYRNVAQMIG